MTVMTVSVDAMWRDMYPRAGERIKQWVIDERNIAAREQATCPRIDLPGHDDNTGAPCRNIGSAPWIDAQTHDCCGFCGGAAEEARARADVAAWIADRTTWPQPCADRSVLSDEVAPDLSLRGHPCLMPPMMECEGKP